MPRIYYPLTIILLAAFLFAACTPTTTPVVTPDDPAAPITPDPVDPTPPPSVEETPDPVTPVTGEPVPEIEIITTTEAYDPIRYEAGFIIADAWEQLGFQVTVRPMEFSTALERFYDEQDFDATILGWSGRVERLDPQHFLGTLHSGQADLGGNNPGGYLNPEYDELFDAQSREFDTETRRDIVHEMQDVYKSEAPVIVLFYRDEVIAYNNERFDNLVTMAGEGLYNEWTPLQAVPLGDDMILTIGSPQEPDTINPVDSTSVWGWKWMRMYYDKLVRLSPEVEPVPWAAEEINPIDDTTIEIVLRQGMLWHDGEPVTVEDVKFTFDYYIDQDFAYFRPFYAPIESVEIMDENTVRFNLSQPFAPFVTVTLSQIPILPMHIWEDIEVAAELSPADIPTVGSGPFIFDRYDRGEFMSLRVNPDHFATGDTQIEGVEYIIYADAEGVFTGMQTGEIDMTAWRLEPAQIPLAEGEDHLTIVSVPDFGYYHITYNLRRAPFDDVAVRRALSYAIDRERMVNVLLDGRGEIGSSIIAPVNNFWHNPFIERFDYDLDMARQELENAGYSWDANGRLLSSGQ
jgi:peptide/nickel transport system substrate-binding protein